MTEKKKNVKFNKKNCDWRYNAACAADANCYDDCPMPCPYDKEQSPCDMCKVRDCDRKKCKALKTYRNRDK